MADFVTRHIEEPKTHFLGSYPQDIFHRFVSFGSSCSQQDIPDSICHLIPKEWH